MRPHLVEEERRRYGHYYHLLDRESRDPALFTNYTRLSPALFEEILGRITPAIQKQNTNWRLALEPGVKLAATLRYLATGDNYRTVSYAFLVGVSSISKFVPEVCQAIIEANRGEVFPQYMDEDDWKAIDKFWTR